MLLRNEIFPLQHKDNVCTVSESERDLLKDGTSERDLLKDGILNDFSQ